MEQEHRGSMRYRERDGVGYLTFPAFDRVHFVRHAFSTRVGGVSPAPFNTMNLSRGRGDSDAHVNRNLHLLCDAVGVDYCSLVSSAQDHHTQIRRVGRRECGIGVRFPADRQSVDGLITDEPGVTLLTHYADCTPLFFLDRKKRAIGLAHAGWRGTAAQIGAITVQSMQKEFSSDPADILVGIGPSIGSCCFEVDRDVAEAFMALWTFEPNAFVKAGRPGKYQVDLWEANRRILLGAGILAQHITVGGLCSCCNHSWLWSHRATKGVRGGMAALMQLLPE